MSLSIHLLANDGEAPLATVAAEEGQTILDALLRAGVAFSYSCQAGSCGSCKCELVDGDVLPLESSEHALSDEERTRGLILACRTQVWGDTHIRRLADEELVLHPSRLLNCRVSKLDWLTHDIREVRLQHDSPSPLLFSPGQYVDLEFHPTEAASSAPPLKRPYSMACATDDGELVFQIRHMPDGRTSSHVAQHLSLGDKVTLSGPHGSAWLRDQHTGPVLMVAGGSGLAPIEAMLSRLLSLRQNDSTPVYLYVGARTERDLYHQNTRHDWGAANLCLRLHTVLSQADTADATGSLTTARDESLRHGHVHQALEADIAAGLIQLAGLKAYIAGPPAMVDAVSALLAQAGMASRDLHADAFYNQNDLSASARSP
jgi:ferredoxin-NAD(P)+ reductase (naphthalene dioxygenase ferredoxin-specific)